MQIPEIMGDHEPMEPIGKGLCELEEGKASPVGKVEEEARF
jgi:hypothetical protein